MYSIILKRIGQSSIIMHYIIDWESFQILINSYILQIKTTIIEPIQESPDFVKSLEKLVHFDDKSRTSEE